MGRSQTHARFFSQMNPIGGEKGSTSIKKTSRAILAEMRRPSLSARRQTFATFMISPASCHGMHLKLSVQVLGGFGVPSPYPDPRTLKVN